MDTDVKAGAQLQEKIIEKIRKKALYGPENFRAALISHYVHTKDEQLAAQAVQFAKELLAAHSVEVDDAGAEEAIRLLFPALDVHFPTPSAARFTFIDVFAGIGGFRMAMQRLGGRCVFTSEWDAAAQKTYAANYGEIPFGDLTKEETKQWIPATFDLLCAGFPCQPFSIAGVSKKLSLGRKHGFEDETQGNLFFHLAEIIGRHRPKAFLLENVKNLVSHDKGNTFRVIRETLEGLDYSFHHRVLNGKHFVPQHRERTFMAGFDKRIYGEDVAFEFPLLPEPAHRLRDILETDVPDKYTLTDHLWNYLQNYAQKHKAAGNGFGFGLAPLDGITRTMSARYYKDGSEILIPQEGKNPRRLTPREAALLLGYSEKFRIPVADTPAYRQFGNSVVVPLVEEIGGRVCEILLDECVGQ